MNEIANCDHCGCDIEINECDINQWNHCYDCEEEEVCDDCEYEVSCCECADYTWDDEE